MTDLISMSPIGIMENWRPGSQGDDWTWADEYSYLWMIDGPRTNKIIEIVKEKDIDFDDTYNPILLGNDGRVWDGHHRILIARYLEIDSVNVSIAPRLSKEN